MAYMPQEKKKELAPKIKSVLKKYGMKGSISVNNHSTLVCTLKSGALDIIQNARAEALRRNGESYVTEDQTYLQVNPYWLQENYTGEVQAFLCELRAAMNDGNHDRSDIMTDYFDVGWYIDINVGKWNKPYILEI